MKYENINLCTIWTWNFTHWAFDFKKDWETMIRLLKWLCEEVESLKEDNKQLTIKVETLMLLDKLTWKDIEKAGK